MYDLLNCPAADIVRKLNDCGHEAYFVGGCVRDALMGRKYCDCDITVNAPPHAIKSALSGMKTVDTGILHGTVTVVLKNENAEVTSFRTDGAYSDFRHPQGVTFTGDLISDLSRRDFTVNSMAMDLNGNIIDRFGGIDDIKNKILRAVGNPDERLTQDALRILRALRFMSVLSFKSDDALSEAIARHCHLLKKISGERIFSELKKAVFGESFDTVLQKYKSVFFCIFGEEYDIGRIRLSLLPRDCITRIAALLYGCKNYSEAVKAFNCSKKESEKIFFLLKNADRVFPSKSSAAELLNEYGTEYALCLADFKKAAFSEDAALFYTHITDIMSRGCIKIKDLKISGNDIKRLTGSRGKETGEILDKLFYAVINGDIENKYKALCEYSVQLSSV